MYYIVSIYFVYTKYIVVHCTLYSSYTVIDPILALSTFSIESFHFLPSFEKAKKFPPETHSADPPAPKHQKNTHTHTQSHSENTLHQQWIPE